MAVFQYWLFSCIWQVSICVISPSHLPHNCWAYLLVWWEAKVLNTPKQPASLPVLVEMLLRKHKQMLRCLLLSFLLTVCICNNSNSRMTLLWAMFYFRCQDMLVNHGISAAHLFLFHERFSKITVQAIHPTRFKHVSPQLHFKPFVSALLIIEHSDSKRLNQRTAW